MRGAGSGPEPEARAFEQLAGWAGIVTGVAGAGYAVSFVVLKNATLSAIFLLVGPLVSTLVLVALYGRLRRVEPSLALWVLLISVVGALGASVHGGYDLANVLHPPTASSDFPNAIDPRGLLTFGASGLALVAASWLIARTGEFPSWTPPAALALGVALVATYLARLIVFDANSPVVLGPALVAGVLSPILYIGIGYWFMRRQTLTERAALQRGARSRPPAMA
jgi:hypothetical protein